MKRLCRVTVLVAHLLTLTLTVYPMTRQSNNQLSLVGWVAVPKSGVQTQRSTLDTTTWGMVAAVTIPAALSFGMLAFKEYKNKKREELHVEKHIRQVVNPRGRVVKEEHSWQDKPGHPGAAKKFLKHDCWYGYFTLAALTAGGVGIYAFNQWWKSA